MSACCEAHEIIANIEAAQEWSEAYWERAWHRRREARVAEFEVGTP